MDKKNSTKIIKIINILHAYAYEEFKKKLNSQPPPELNLLSITYYDTIVSNL